MKINIFSRKVLAMILFVSGIFLAIQVQAKALNMASYFGASRGDTFYYANDIISDAAANWFKKGIRIGSQGTGGVTFFNGTIVNETTREGKDNPVTFGDNVRIDGVVFRGETPGKSSDEFPVKIDDRLMVLGDAEFEGGVTVDGPASVGTSLTVNDDATIADDATIKDLIITGSTDLSGTVDFTGASITGLGRPYDALVSADGTGHFTTIESALFAGKKCLFVKNATYVPTTDLNFPAGGCLIGESPESTVIDLNGGNFQILVKGESSSVTVDQVRFESFSIRESSDPEGAIALENVGSIRLRNVTIGANSTMGLRLKNVSYGVIEGNRITTNSGDGIWMSDGNYHNVVISNIISSNGGDGIQIDGSESTTDSAFDAINSNIVKSNTGNGIFVRGADFLMIGGNIASGNTLDGIDLAKFGTDQADENVVTGNQLNANAGVGIEDNGTATVSSGNAT